MGESQSTALRVEFNGSLRIEGRGERLTANGGALLLREVDERLGFTSWLTSQLHDPRNPALVTHSLPELLRARLFAMVLGHRDQDDLDRHREDPALRAAVSDRRGVGPVTSGGRLASQPTQSRLLESLSSPENRRALNEGLFELARRDLRASGSSTLDGVTIDVDSFALEVHGQQAGTAYNRHYGIRCYHPLVTMLSETSHLLSAELRAGNVHTANGAVDHLLPVIERVNREFATVTAVRGDAGFPSEPLLSALEDRGIGYTFRLKANAVLDRLALPHLKRPVGRPPKEPRTWLHELSYQAGSWSHPRRIVLVVLERPGQLHLDRFFLVTNWPPSVMSAEQLLEHYRQRGTMEQHLGELQSVLAPALSSAARPKRRVKGRKPRNTKASRDAEAANAATLLLYALAYNLANTVRRLASRMRPSRKATSWSLDRVRDALLRVAARVTISARRATFVLNASVAHVWQGFLRAAAKLRPQGRAAAVP